MYELKVTELGVKDMSHRLFNLDETGKTTDLKKAQLFFKKGIRDALPCANRRKDLCSLSCSAVVLLVCTFPHSLTGIPGNTVDPGAEHLAGSRSESSAATELSDELSGTVAGSSQSSNDDCSPRKTMRMAVVSALSSKKSTLQC